MSTIEGNTRVVHCRIPSSKNKLIGIILEVGYMPNPGDVQRDSVELLRNQACLSASLPPGGHKAPTAWKTSKASSPSGWEASLSSPINSLSIERFPNECGTIQICLFPCGWRNEPNLSRRERKHKLNGHPTTSFPLA